MRDRAAGAAPNPAALARARCLSSDSTSWRSASSPAQSSVDRRRPLDARAAPAPRATSGRSRPSVQASSSGRRGYGESALKSHARAACQSRSTVLGESVQHFAHLLEREAAEESQTAIWLFLRVQRPRAVRARRPDRAGRRRACARTSPASSSDTSCARPMPLARLPRSAGAVDENATHHLSTRPQKTAPGSARPPDADHRDEDTPRARAPWAGGCAPGRSRRRMHGRATPELP